MTHTYAFVGLTPSERSLLESIFAMDADESSHERGDEGLVPVRLGVDKVPVNLLIVNGDDLEVVAQLHATHPEALLVLVGHPPGGQGVRWPVMRRPLDLHGAVSVLSELDWPDTPLERRMAVRQRPQATVQVSDGGQPSHQPPQLSQPSQPPSSRPPPTTFSSEDMSSAFAPTTARMPMPAAGPAAAQPGLSARAAWAMSERGAAEGPASSPAHRPPPSSVPMAASAPMPPLSVPPADTVLAADEDVSAADTAGHVLPVADPVAPAPSPRRADVLVVHSRRDGQMPSMVRGLRDMGYAVGAVGPQEDPVVAIKRHRAAFVFLDQHSLGKSALPLAREIAALRRSPAGPPHLIVVAREGSAFDRLRARMAGCGWMQVPIDGDRLASYLTGRGLPRPHGGR